MTHKHDLFNERQITSAPITPAEIAQAMLLGWKNVMPAHYRLDLTPERQAQLNFLFTKVFNSKFMRWFEFVDLIADNECLMSKVAGGNIDWAIEPQNCQMILDGDYPGGANDSSASQGSSTDAAQTAPATPAHPATPAAPAINGEKEYSHGGMLARRVPKAGS